MVQRVKFSLILICSIGFITNGFSLQLGVYHQIYEKYIEGYQENELVNYPVKSVYESLGGESDQPSIYEYEYEKDGDGNVIEMKEYASETGLKKIYTYTYQNNHLIKVEANWYTRSGDLKEHYWLDILYEEDKIIETHYEEGKDRIEAEYIYSLDSDGRIVNILCRRWSPFSKSIEESFEWSIQYEDNKIVKMQSVSDGDKELFTEFYRYPDESTVVISQKNGRRTEIKRL